MTRPRGRLVALGVMDGLISGFSSGSELEARYGVLRDTGSVAGPLSFCTTPWLRDGSFPSRIFSSSSSPLMDRAMRTDAARTVPGRTSVTMSSQQSGSMRSQRSRTGNEGKRRQQQTLFVQAANLKTPTLQETVLQGPWLPAPKLEARTQKSSRGASGCTTSRSC